MSDYVSNMVDTSQGNDSNIEEGRLTKRSFLGRVDVLGANEGKGDNSRPGLFILAAEAATNRVIGLDKRPDKTDDADEIFDRYSKKVAASQGVGWKPQSSAKQQTSKLRTAIKLGTLPQVSAMEVINTVVKAQAEQRASQEGKNDYPPFDGLVKVARFQIQYPDAQLTKEQIEQLLIKPAKADLNEADKLEKVMKACEKASEDADMAEGSREALQEAATEIMTRITALGGSTSMRKLAAKAASDTAALVALTDVARKRAASAAALVQPGLEAYLAKQREGIGTGEACAAD